MLDDYPKIKLVGTSIITIVIILLIFILVYKENLSKYLEDNWTDIRCNPLAIPLAGLVNTVEGKNYGDKVTNNFNKCMNSNISGNLGPLLQPFMNAIGGIIKIIIKIGESLNSFREALGSIRVMFQAFIGNTIDKLSNSYAAMVYFREKMKHIIKRQVAIMEIISQFLTAFPFLIYSLSHGPLPRFAVWFGKYLGILIAILIICLLCAFGGFFVQIFACPICALCFTEDSLVGRDEYEKKIRDINIGDKLDNNTIVTGRIYIKGDEKNKFPMYRLNNNCILTGSHLVYMNGWKRVKDIGIKVEYLDDNIICLITNNHNIPTNKYMFKDYLETSDSSVLFRQMDTIKQYLNYRNMENINKIDNIRPICSAGFSKQTLKELEKNDNNEIYGWVEIKEENIEWYKYDDMVLTANQLVYTDGVWKRVYECKGSNRIDYMDDRIYNVISVNGSLVCNGNILRDFMETHNKEVQDELLRQLDKYHNII
jgi:hypothetical protein